MTGAGFSTPPRNEIPSLNQSGTPVAVNGLPSAQLFQQVRDLVSVSVPVSSGIIVKYQEEFAVEESRPSPSATVHSAIVPEDRKAGWAPCLGGGDGSTLATSPVLEHGMARPPQELKVRTPGEFTAPASREYLIGAVGAANVSITDAFAASGVCRAPVAVIEDVSAARETLV